MCYGDLCVIHVHVCYGDDVCAMVMMCAMVMCAMVMMCAMVIYVLW